MTTARVNSFTEALIVELEKLRGEYDNRESHLQRHDLSIESAGKIIAVATAVGSAAGTPIPLVGNVIGAGVGAGSGVIIAMGLGVHYKRVNKKLSNAEDVLKFLGDKHEAKKILANAAKQIIEEREHCLFHELEDAEKHKEIITKYLAVNMVKAIKDYVTQHGNIQDTLTMEDKVNLILEGVKRAQSHKISSRELQAVPPISLRSIAQAVPPRLTSCYGGLLTSMGKSSSSSSSLDSKDAQPEAKAFSGSLMKITR
jgi:hypothetical protein